MNLSMRIEYQYGRQIMEAAVLLTGRTLARHARCWLALSAGPFWLLPAYPTILYLITETFCQDIPPLWISWPAYFAGLAAYIMLFLKLFGLSVAPSDRFPTALSSLSYCCFSYYRF